MNTEAITDLEPGYMPDAAFTDLIEQIEWYMTELARLQEIHRSQVGKDYVMPIYTGPKR